MMRFNEAISATPDSKDILSDYGSTLQKYALLQPLAEAHHFYELAVENFRHAGNDASVKEMANSLQQILDTVDLGNWKLKARIQMILIECYKFLCKTDKTPFNLLTWAYALLDQAK